MCYLGVAHTDPERLPSLLCLVFICWRMDRLRVCGFVWLWGSDRCHRNHHEQSMRDQVLVSDHMLRSTAVLDPVAGCRYVGVYPFNMHRLCLFIRSSQSFPYCRVIYNPRVNCGHWNHPTVRGVVGVGQLWHRGQKYQCLCQGGDKLSRGLLICEGKS